ncbi:MAG TPA: acyl-CoA thioesterase [Saprospiraceae bacterium]|nr:acyl-CoA thioesterase [Saprospiraceae bacterium]
MKNYIKSYEVKWSDTDPNKHMRHTAYNDYACQARIGLFESIGLTYTYLTEQGLGPILLQENTSYKREVNLSEKISVKCYLSSLSEDGRFWTFMHQIFKEDGNLAAEIVVQGSFIDLNNRRITTPSEEVLGRFYKLFSMSQTAG